MHSFNHLDWIVVFLYLAACVLLGSSFYRKNRSGRDFFVTSQSVSWLPVAISIIATDLSALSYIGVPAMVVQGDLRYMLAVVALPVQVLVIVTVFMPVLYSISRVTVYEYLEIRFNTATRTCVSLLFLGGRGAYLAIVNYGTGVALSEVTGMNIYLAIVLCGGTTALYAILGGMEAIIWTDMLQFVVLVGGILTLLTTIGLAYDGDVAAIWQSASVEGHTKLFEFSMDPTVEFTFWGILIGTLAVQLNSYATDQVIVQRYFATKDRRAATASVIGATVLLIPLLVLLYAVGVGLAAYYHDHPELRATLSSVDRVLPHFVVNRLPQGLRGLVIAGIFAATMSTVSSVINSLTASSVRDLLIPLIASVKERELAWARRISLFWGAVGTFGAMSVVRWQLNIFEKFALIYQFFAGPMLGIFLLGVLTRRTTSTGSLVGMACGFGVVATLAGMTKTHWLWYAPAGCLVTIACGYAASLIAPGGPQQKTLQDEIPGPA